MLKPSNITNYKFIAGSGVSDKELPASFILPEDRIPTVRDQKSYGACVGHAIASVVGIFYGAEFGGEKLMSPWYIYGNPACRNGYDGYGMFVEDAIDGVRKSGTVPLEYFDIHMEAPGIIEAVESRPELAEIALPYKIKSYLEIPMYAMLKKRSDTIKQALITYQSPVVIASKRYFGESHCVIVIGWDKNDRFIFQNSWGEDYKDDGRWTIPCEYINEAYVLLDEVLELPFDDVSEDDWFYKDVKTAYFSGIINGTSSSSFGSNDFILRSEAAAIIVRMLNKVQESVDAYARSQEAKGESFDVPNFLKYPGGQTVTCSDLDESEWYYDDVVKIIELGIMQGDDTGVFRPDDTISRAEAAAVICRAYDYVRDKLGLPDDLKITEAEFPDVDKLEWYYDVVCRAVSYGFMYGDDDGVFRPTDGILRPEFTSIIVRVMKSVNGILTSLCDI